MKRISEVIALETFIFPLFLLIHFSIAVGFLKEKIKLSNMKSGIKNRRFHICKVKLGLYNVQHSNEIQASVSRVPFDGGKPACHTWAINGLLSSHLCPCCLLRVLAQTLLFFR